MAAAVVERHDAPAIPAVKHYRLLEDVRASLPSISSWSHAATYQQLVRNMSASSPEVYFNAP